MSAVREGRGPARERPAVGDERRRAGPWLSGLGDCVDADPEAPGRQRGHAELRENTWRHDQRGDGDWLAGGLRGRLPTERFEKI